MIEITISTGGVTEIDFTDASAANAAVTAKNETEQLKADVETLKSDTQGLRDAAEGFKNTAETKAGEANADAGVAVTARQGSENAQVKAQQWADANEDVEVEAGKYSAKHWAAKSEEEKTAAANTFVTNAGNIDALRLNPYDGPVGRLVAWDTFVRVNEAIENIVDNETENANGLKYRLLDSPSLARIDSRAFVRMLQCNQFVGLDATQLLNSTSNLTAGFICEMSIISASQGNRFGLVLYVDANNWYKVCISSKDIFVIEKNAGVETVLNQYAMGGTFLRTIQRLIITYSSQSNVIGIGHLNFLTNYIPTSPSIINEGREITHISFEGSILNYRIFNNPQV